MVDRRTLVPARAMHPSAAKERLASNACAKPETPQLPFWVSAITSGDKVLATHHPRLGTEEMADCVSTALKICTFSAKAEYRVCG
jgi:hypothetical protein